MVDLKTTTDYLVVPPATPNTLQKFRTQILNVILRVFFALGAIAMLVVTFNAILDGRMYLFVVYACIYIFLGIVTFREAWGYQVRAGLLLFFLYSFGFIGFSQVGLFSNGLLFLIAFNVLATVFFNLRGGTIALVISLVTYCFFGWLAVSQSIGFPSQPQAAVMDSAVWIRAGVVVFLLSTILSLSNNYITQQLEHELTKSTTNQQLISSVLNMANILVVVLDCAGRLIHLNHTCEKTLGHSFESIKHNFFWDIFVSENEKEQVKQYILDPPENQAAQPKENRWYSKHGEPIVVTWSLTRLYDQTNTPQHLVITGLDITTQKQAELERERLFTAEREQRQLAEALHDITVALNSTLHLDELLDRIFTNIGRVVPHDAVDIVLIENVNTLRVAGSRGYRAQGYHLPEALLLNLDEIPNLAYILSTGRPKIIEDAWQDPNWTTMPHTDWVRSYLGAPIRLQDEVIGFIDVAAAQPGFFTVHHAARLLAFADQASIAFGNIRSLEAERERRKFTEALRQASLALSATLDMDTLLDRLLDHVASIVPFDAANIMLADQRRAYVARMQGYEQFGPDTAKAIAGLSLDIDETDNLRRMASTGQPLVIKDRTNQNNWLKIPAITDLRAWAGAPIVVQDRVVAFFSLDKIEPGFYDTKHQERLSIFASQTALAMENARLYKRVQQHAAELEARVKQRTFELQTLYELAHALGQVKQFDDVFRLILKHLHQAVRCDVAASSLIIENKPTIFIQCRHKLSAASEKQLQADLLQAVAPHTKQSATEAGFDIDYLRPAAAPGPQQQTPITIHTTLQAPITIGAVTVGALLIGSQQTEPFTREQKRLLYTITEQAAETTGRLQILLAAEHQRLESLIANLPNSLILLDNELRIVLTNRVAKVILQSLTNAKIGDEIEELNGHPIEAILESAENDTPYLLEVAEPTSQIYEIDVNPVRDGPEIGGWTLLIRDVTEERVLQKRIQQQERLAAVGQLAAGIAHDFNNILTSIIGFAELILLSPDLQDSIRDDVERITKQGHRAAHLVRQILDFSRQTIREKKPVELVPVRKETIKLLERTLPEDIHIDVEVEAGDYAITADITQLQQALTNLAVNSRDAMPAGGTLLFRLSSLHVTAEAAPPDPEMGSGSWIVLQIADTGTGIAPDIQDQIFEPFFTTKEVGKGTGLGLAQVYGIIKQHEGFIEVESAPQMGTTFTVYLPTPTSVELPNGSGTMADIPLGHEELILLVEDDDMVLNIGKSMLTHLGYRVVVATNGQEALNIYPKHRDDISLVLTDMTMPHMGGAELTSALRRQNPDVKVVALTGYPLEAQDKELLSQGIMTWLQKPLSMKKLAQAIHYSLYQASTQPEPQE